MSLAEKKDVRDPESKPPVRAEENPQKIRREFFADANKEAAAGAHGPREIRREFFADMRQQVHVAVADSADADDIEARQREDELVA